MIQLKLYDRYENCKQMNASYSNFKFLKRQHHRINETKLSVRDTNSRLCSKHNSVLGTRILLDLTFFFRAHVKYTGFILSDKYCLSLPAAVITLVWLCHLAAAVYMYDKPAYSK
jgi:hypothetical protein